MFVGWEGVGLCSYLLIGFWFEDAAKAAAGKKAFIVNRIGDFGFLLGMFLLFWSFGTLDFRTVMAEAPHGAAPWAGGLVTAITPAALRRRHRQDRPRSRSTSGCPTPWPAPRPVSALIHAATMVTAGVYMVGAAATSSSSWRPPPWPWWPRSAR